VDVTVEKSGDVAAEIFDAGGRLVKSLKRGFLPAGKHTLRWEGDTDAGTNAASGVYFVRVTAGGKTATVKITLVR
jgi:flagellar hook assembly protein FlgD